MIEAIDLKSNKNFQTIRGRIGRAAIRVAIGALGIVTISGCIESKKPVLDGAKPAIGESGKLHVFTLSEGTAREPGVASYRWTGTNYTMSMPSEKDSEFTAHPLSDRDWIIQAGSANKGAFAYSVARKLADSVYLIAYIDRDHVDETTRKTLCVEQTRITCRIETREQLLAFARATAARTGDSGGLVVIVPDRKP